MNIFPRLFLIATFLLALAGCSNSDPAQEALAEVNSLAKECEKLGKTKEAADCYFESADSVVKKHCGFDNYLEAIMKVTFGAENVTREDIASATNECAANFYYEIQKQDEAAED